jgi:predicted GIY-YIG superfamily endonuclease
MKQSYYIYALMQQGKPVFVGCTSNITSRIKAHGKFRVPFTGFTVLETYEDRSEALRAERLLQSYIDLSKQKK